MRIETGGDRQGSELVFQQINNLARSDSAIENKERRLPQQEIEQKMDIHTHSQPFPPIRVRMARNANVK